VAVGSLSDLNVEVGEHRLTGGRSPRTAGSAPTGSPAPSVEHPVSGSITSGSEFDVEASARSTACDRDDQAPAITAALVDDAPALTPKATARSSGREDDRRRSRIEKRDARVRRDRARRASRRLAALMDADRDDRSPGPGGEQPSSGRRIVRHPVGDRRGHRDDQSADRSRQHGRKRRAKRTPRNRRAARSIRRSCRAFRRGRFPRSAKDRTLA